VAPNSTLHFFNAPPGISEDAVMQVGLFSALFAINNNLQLIIICTSLYAVKGTTAAAST